MTAAIINADCLDALRAMPDNSVDSIVTDPPYGLSNIKPERITEAIVAWASGDRERVPDGRGFMGKAWDSFVPPPAVWDECLRVLKPGGHLVAFAGSRTHDLMGLSIRMAGFEIRDGLAWLYGSGFPKSMDVSKAIDKLDAAAERRERALEFTAWIRECGLTAGQIDKVTGTNMGGHFTTAAAQPAVATADLFDKLRPLLPEVPERIEQLVAQRTVESANFKAREVVGVCNVPVGHSFAGETYGGNSASKAVEITAAHTSEARRWQGWGTALKPAFEPVTLARKPLEGTAAANVLKWGTGALNIDATRITTSQDDVEKGRWPANAVLDEHQATALDEQAEGASRYFYCPKASSKERPEVDGVRHNTVKPLALMRWLVRLVTPPGGTVLDPFAGSGTTLEAAALEGFSCTGIELDPQYAELCRVRIKRADEAERDLFGEAS